MSEDIDETVATDGTGFWARLARAVDRRLPKMRSLMVFTGPPDIKFEGFIEEKGFRVVDITPENVDQALSFRKTEVVKQMRDYLEKGCRGWFAMLGDTIVAYAFLAIVKDRPKIVRRLLLHPGEAGIILVYARPEYRIFGLGTAMGKLVSARAAAAGGIHRLVAWTVPSHESWIRALGEIEPPMLPAGKVRIFEIFGRPVFRYTTGSPVKR